MSALGAVPRPPRAQPAPAVGARAVPGWYHPAKRALDVAAASAGLILASPVLLVAMLGIAALTSKAAAVTANRLIAGLLGGGMCGHIDGMHLKVRHV